MSTLSTASIGAAIKNLRKKRDMTQEQLAEYLGVTSRAVSQWECGREAAELLRPRLQEYPDSFRLMNALMNALFKVEVNQAGDDIRYNTVQTLCIIYPEADETDKARAQRPALTPACCCAGKNTEPPLTEAPKTVPWKC